MKKKLGLFAILTAFGLAQHASAVDVTDTFNVTATVISSCQVSAGDMTFGNYDPLGAAVDQTSTIGVTCSNGTGWTLKLDEGTYAGTFDPRIMEDGSSNQLNYNLYTDAGRTTIWNETTNVVTDTGSGVVQNQTVYGRIPTGQTTVPPGAYSDIVTATVTY